MKSFIQAKHKIQDALLMQEYFSNKPEIKGKHMHRFPKVVGGSRRRSGNHTSCFILFVIEYVLVGAASLFKVVLLALFYLGFTV